jgi:hypothetical protein
MMLAVLQFELTIPHSLSLKDKRRVVKSLKDRLHREHLVSIAEVAALDDHRRAVLAVVLVSASAPHASSVLDAIVEKLKGLHDARLGGVSRLTIHESEFDWADGDPPKDDPAWAAAEEAMARDAQRLLEEDRA